MRELVAAVDGTDVTPLPVPADMQDGVLAAHWRRPHAYLDEQVRRSTSTFRQLPKSVTERAISQLESDLQDGTWHRRYGHLLDASELDAGYRIVVR